MKWRTLSVFTWLLLLLGGCSVRMHSEFRTGTRSSGTAGGESTRTAQPEHEHDHDHEHEHEQEHGRGDVVRVVRPQSSGDQAGSGSAPASPSGGDSKPADGSDAQPPRRVGKPATESGSWSGVGAPREPAPSVQRPAQGGAGWSGVGAASDRPAGEGSAGSGQPGAGAGGSAGSASDTDASAGKDDREKRESEPHYSRRKPRKKADKPPAKGEGSDNKETEQAPAGPKRERSDNKDAEQQPGSKRER